MCDPEIEKGHGSALADLVSSCQKPDGVLKSAKSCADITAPLARSRHTTSVEQRGGILHRLQEFLGRLGVVAQSKQRQGDVDFDEVALMQIRTCITDRLEKRNRQRVILLRDVYPAACQSGSAAQGRIVKFVCDTLNHGGGLVRQLGA